MIEFKKIAKFKKNSANHSGCAETSGYHHGNTMVTQNGGRRKMVVVYLLSICFPVPVIIIIIIFDPRFLHTGRWDDGIQQLTGNPKPTMQVGNVWQNSTKGTRP